MLFRSIKISASLKNNQNRDQPYAFLVQVQDQNGIAVGDILTDVSTLPPLRSFNPMLNWIFPKQGRFYIQVFVWEAVDNPSALCMPTQLEIVVS